MNARKPSAAMRWRRRGEFEFWCTASELDAAAKELAWIRADPLWSTMPWNRGDEGTVPVGKREVRWRKAS